MTVEEARKIVLYWAISRVEKANAKAWLTHFAMEYNLRYLKKRLIDE